MSETNEKKRPDSDLDAVIEALLDYLDQKNVKFSGGQLDEAGKHFERYDPATARMLVEGNDQENAAALLEVLRRVERAGLMPDRASYLIRHLNQIRKYRRKMQ